MFLKGYVSIVTFISLIAAQNCVETTNVSSKAPAPPIDQQRQLSSRVKEKLQELDKLIDVVLSVSTSMEAKAEEMHRRAEDRFDKMEAKLDLVLESLAINPRELILSRVNTMQFMEPGQVREGKDATGVPSYVPYTEETTCAKSHPSAIKVTGEDESCS